MPIYRATVIKTWMVRIDTEEFEADSIENARDEIEYGCVSYDISLEDSGIDIMYADLDHIEEIEEVVEE